MKKNKKEVRNSKNYLKMNNSINVIYFNKKTLYGKMSPVNIENYTDKEVKIDINSINISDYTNIIDDWYVLTKIVDINYYSSTFDFCEDLLFKAVGVINDVWCIRYTDSRMEIHFGNPADSFLWQRTNYCDNLKILDFDI